MRIYKSYSDETLKKKTIESVLRNIGSLDQRNPSALKSTSQILAKAIDVLSNSSVSDEVLKKSLNSIQDTVADQLKWISGQNRSLVGDKTAAQFVVGTLVEGIRLTTSIKDDGAQEIFKNFQTNLNAAVIDLSDRMLLGENTTTIIGRSFKIDAARTEFQPNKTTMHQQYGLVIEHRAVNHLPQSELKSGLVTYFFDPLSHFERSKDDKSNTDNGQIVEMIINSTAETSSFINRVEILLPLTADSYVQSHTVTLPRTCDPSSGNNITPCGAFSFDIVLDSSSLGERTAGE